MDANACLQKELGQPQLQVVALEETSVEEAQPLLLAHSKTHALALQTLLTKEMMETMMKVELVPVQEQVQEGRL